MWKTLSIIIFLFALCFSIAHADDTYFWIDRENIQRPTQFKRDMTQKTQIKMGAPILLSSKDGSQNLDQKNSSPDSIVRKQKTLNKVIKFKKKKILGRTRQPRVPFDSIDQKLYPRPITR